MVTKSWIVTLIPLAIYIIGIGLRMVGYEMTPDLSEAFSNMILFFLGSAGVGVVNSIAKAKKKG